MATPPNLPVIPTPPSTGGAGFSVPRPPAASVQRPNDPYRESTDDTGSDESRTPIPVAPSYPASPTPKPPTAPRFPSPSPTPTLTPSAAPVTPPISMGPIQNNHPSTTDLKPTEEPTETDEALPPNHYEIRTMPEDLKRLQATAGTPTRTAAATTIKPTTPMPAAIIPPSKPRPPTPLSGVPSPRVPPAPPTLRAIIPRFSLAAALNNKRILLIIAVVLLVIAGGITWRLVTPTSEQAPETAPIVEQPSSSAWLETSYPSPLPFPRPAATSLSSAAATPADIALFLRDVREQPLALNAVATLQLETPPTTGALLGSLGIDIPPAVVEAIGADGAAPTIFATADGVSGVRFGLAIDLRSSSSPDALINAMQSWEPTMADDLAVFFTGLAKGEAATPSFQEASFFNPLGDAPVTVRYQNFPTPSISVDYWIHQGALWITTSKDSFLFLISAPPD